MTTNGQSILGVLKEISRRGGALWRRLIDPAEAIQEPEDRRRARLLAGMLVVIIVVGVWMFVSTLFVDLAATDSVAVVREKPFFFIVSMGLVIFGVAYRLSRSRHYVWGAFILIVNICIAGFLVAANSPEPAGVVGNLNLLTLGILLGSLFLPLWGTTILYVIILLGIQALARFPIPAVVAYPYPTTIAFNNVLIVGVLVMVSAAMRRQDLKQIQQQAQELVENTLDIARRKQAAETLAEERNLLRTLIDNIPDHIFVKDTESRFIVNNVGHMYSLGVTSHEELVGKVDADFIAPELAARYYAEEQEIIRSCQPLTGREEFLIDPEGREQWFLTTKAPLRDVEGEVVGLVGISRNITERKRAAEALRASEERFRSLVENTNDWIWEVDRDGTFTYTNPKIKDLLGYEAEELIGTSLYDLMSRDDAERVSAVLYEIVVSQRPTFERLENRSQHKDGRLVVLEGSGVPILDANGNWLGHRGISRDTTVRKLAEETLLKAKQAAEEAQRAAEAANKAKSQFLATMSHELRTPLNGILGYAQILKRDSVVSQRQLDGLDIIEQSGHDLLSLINDILDLAKVEAGKVELYEVGFDLCAFLRGIGEMFCLRAEYQGLDFHTEFVIGGAKGDARDVPVGVLGDARRLRQVLINLLGNAIKFTDVGSVTFKVERVDGGSAGVQSFRFMIRDTGIGMSPEELSIIFEPFQQGGDWRRQTRGTGLGLTISRDLIELMGGKLHVESTLNEGAVFWFDLALPNAADWAKALPLEERRIVAVKGKPKALVVDDNWQNRVVIVDLLSPIGFEVQEAKGGPEGLACAVELLPDVIFTDLIMPEMSGIEFIRQLRQLPALRDVVIIAISASAYDADQQRSLAAGSNAFVHKPVEASDLFAQLQRHLGLEWVYADVEQLDGCQLDGGVADVAPMLPPPPDDLAALFKLVIMGDLGAIQNRADELERADDRLKPFATELRRLAKEFEIERMRDLLESYQE